MNEPFPEDPRPEDPSPESGPPACPNDADDADDAAAPDGPAAGRVPAASVAPADADRALDAWVRDRREVDVPPGFRDRVMARIVPSRRERTLRVAAVILAVVAAGARIAATFAVFVTR